MASDIYSAVGRVSETPQSIDRSIDNGFCATLQCLIRFPLQPLFQPTNIERDITVAMLPFCGRCSLINRGLWCGFCNPNSCIIPFFFLVKYER